MSTNHFYPTQDDMNPSPDAPASDEPAGVSLPFEDIPADYAAEMNQPPSLDVENLPAPVQEEPQPEIYRLYDAAPEEVKKLVSHSPEGLWAFMNLSAPEQRAAYEEYIFSGMTRAEDLVLQTPEQKQQIEDIVSKTGLSEDMVRWYQGNAPEALNSLVTNREVVNTAGLDSYVAKSLTDYRKAEKIRRDAVTLAQMEANYQAVAGNAFSRSMYDLRVGVGQVGVFAANAALGAWRSIDDIASVDWNLEGRPTNLSAARPNYAEESAVVRREIGAGIENFALDAQAQWLGPAIDTGDKLFDWLRTSIFQGAPFLVGAIGLSLTTGPTGAAATIATGMGLETYNDTRTAGVSPLLAAAAAGGTTVASYFLNSFQLSRFTRNIQGRSPFRMFSVGAAVEGAQELLSESGESFAQSLMSSTAKLIGAPGYTRDDWWRDMKDGFYAASQEGAAAGTLSLVTRLIGLPGAVRNQARASVSNNKFHVNTELAGQTELFKAGQFTPLAAEMNNIAQHHGGAGIMFASIPDLEQGGISRSQITKSLEEGGLGISEEEYDIAKSANVDIAIPYGNAVVFAERQAQAGNQHFKEIFKADPDAMTGREIYAQQREIEQVMALADTHFKAMESGDAGMPERVKVFRDALRAAGFERNEADASAAVLWARAERAAELWGETPEQWLERREIQVEFDRAIENTNEISQYERRLEAMRRQNDERMGYMSPELLAASEQEIAQAASESGQAETAAQPEIEAAQSGISELMQPAVNDGDNQAWIDEATANIVNSLDLQGEEFAPLAAGIREAIAQGINDPDVRAMAEELGIALPAQTVQPSGEARSAEEILESEPTPIVPLPEPMKQADAENLFAGWNAVTSPDGFGTTFPKSIVGKIKGHRGFDVMTIIPDLRTLFENSGYIGTSESRGEYLDATGQKHKNKPNIGEYKNYVNKFVTPDGTEFYIRFTSQVEKRSRKKPSNAPRHELHSTAISEVQIYDAADLPTRAGLSTPVEGKSAAYKDKILSDFIDSVNSRDESRGIIEDLYQEVQSGGSRGKITFPKYVDAPTIIRLFRNADVSTVIHELNHLFLMDMRDLVKSGKAPERVMSDWAALVKFTNGGLESGDPDTLRGAMEKIASAWERYVMEGKAPRIELEEPFDIFRTYISRVYRGAVELVEPSPEVRTVFDRFLASDAQIVEARRQSGDEQYWLDQVETVNAESRQRANNLRAKAEAQRRRTIDAKKGGGNAFRYITDLDEMRRRVRGEKIADVPVYHAIEEARLNGGLNREVVTGAIGRAGADAMLKHGEDVFGGDVSLDVLARSNGFRDPVAMLTAMSEAQNLDALIGEETIEQINQQTRRDEAAAEEEGDIFADDGSDAQEELIAEETEIAIHKKARRDNSNAARALREYRLRRQAMKNAAMSYVGKLSMREATDVRRYEKAERDARKAAIAVAGKNDWAEVARQKELEMLHHLTVRAAVRARDMRDHIRKAYSTMSLLRTLQAGQYEARVEEAFAEAIKDMATWAGFSDNSRLKPKIQSETLILPSPEAGSNVSDFLPDLAGTLDTWLLNKVKPEGWQDWRDFTFDQVKEIDRAMQLLINQGKGRLNAMRELGVKNIDDMIRQSLAPMSLREPQPATKSDDRTRVGKFLNKANHYLVSLQCPEYWFMAMDGNPTIQGREAGFNQRMFWKIRDCEVEKDRIYKGMIEKLQENFAQFETAKAELETKFGGRLFTILGLPVPDILKTRRNQTTWDAEMLLALALNMGNDANLYAITEGYGLTQYNLNMIGSLFSKDTWNAIQGAWDAIDSMSGQLDAVTFRLTNRHMMKELPQSFTVMASGGEMMQMKGGYYPLVYDPKLSNRAGQFVNEEDAVHAGLMYNIHRSTKPQNGMVMERARDDDGKPLVGRPPLLRLNLLVKHIHASAHYVSHAETIQEFDRMTRHEDWKKMFEDRFGIEKYRAIRNWIQDLARPNRENNSPGAEIMNVFRGLSTVNALGLRPTTAGKQQLGLFQAAASMSDASRTGRSGWGYLKKGLRELGWGALRGAKTEKMQWVDSLSGYMATRDGNHNREIKAMTDQISPLNDTLFTNPLNGKKVTRTMVNDGMFAMIQASDRVGAYATWIGAFEMAMAGDANFDIANMTDEERQAKAVQFADAMASTQASSFAADLTAAQRDQGIMRFVSMFMSGNVRQGSRLMQYIDAYNMGDKSKAEIASFAFREFVAPALAWTAVRAALIYGLAAAFGADPDDDELLTDSIWEIVETAIAPFPIVRELPSAVRFNSGGSVPALSSSAKSLYRGVRGVKRLGDAEYAKAAMDLGDALGFWTGVPATNLVREFHKGTDAAGLTERRK